MQVKLEDILEGIEMQSEESRSYLNLQTGEIVIVSREALWMADDEEEYDHLPDWQQDEVKLAYDIVDSFGKYVSLPTSYDINEYKMMEEFCLNLSDKKIRDRLLSSIKGKGAFRRFKDSVYTLGVADEWYNYRDQCYKEFAKEFCESKSIDYID